MYQLPTFIFRVSFFLSTVPDDISLQTVPKELTQPERNIIVSHFKGLLKAGGDPFLRFSSAGEAPLVYQAWRRCSGRGQYSILLLRSRPGQHIGSSYSQSFRRLLPRRILLLRYGEDRSAYPENLQHSRNGGRRKRCLCRQVASRPDAFGPWFSVWKDFVREGGSYVASVLQGSSGASTLRQLQRAPYIRP